MHSNYVVFPTTFSSPKVVRIVAMVKRFINAFRKKWDPKFKPPQTHSLPADFKTISCTRSIRSLPTTMMYGAHASYFKQPIKTHVSPNQPQFRPVLRHTNTDIQQALYYFYQKATAEVDAFVPADRIRKHMSETRIRLSCNESMGSWIHKEVSNHAGFETAFRHSLDYCFIIHGYSLSRNLVEHVSCAPSSDPGSSTPPKQLFQSPSLLDRTI